MPLNHGLMDRLNNGKFNPTAPTPKYGDEIFAGTDYPKTFEGLVGQTTAKEQLTVSIKSARARGTKLDHCLLASGAHGIGKTSIAQIVAYQMGAGFIAVSGALNVDDARDILTGLADGDILFWDEFHLAVHGSKAKAEWLLPWMTDGVLMTKRGAEPMPEVALLAATTDAGRLPQTIISRFMIRPRLVYYTVEEGAEIAANLASRMRVKLRGKQVFDRISRAANANPREMRMILTAVRDLATLGGPVDLAKAFEWAGVTYDGLTTECQEILLVLLGSIANTASLETLQAALGEPGPLKHHEQLLIQKGLLVVTGRGRTLTEEGVDRARSLLVERAA